MLSSCLSTVFCHVYYQYFWDMSLHAMMPDCSVISFGLPLPSFSPVLRFIMCRVVCLLLMQVTSLLHKFASFKISSIYFFIFPWFSYRSSLKTHIMYLWCLLSMISFHTPGLPAGILLCFGHSPYCLDNGNSLQFLLCDLSVSYWGFKLCWRKSADCTLIVLKIQSVIHTCPMYGTGRTWTWWWFLEWTPNLRTLILY